MASQKPLHYLIVQTSAPAFGCLHIEATRRCLPQNTCSEIENDMPHAMEEQAHTPTHVHRQRQGRFCPRPGELPEGHLLPAP